MRTRKTSFRTELFSGTRGLALCVAFLAACSQPNSRVKTERPPQPHGPAAMLEPSLERRTALADLDPVWVERTRIAFMYDGATVFARVRTPGATGPSTPANTHPVRVVLGNRSGSRGADRDRDGLSDAAEAALGTNADSMDTDGDTLPDSFEIFGTGTLPTRRDTDGDGMDDNLELSINDPNIYADSDGDGFTDGQERAAFNTNPNSIDSDGDGFGDDLEYFFGTEMNDAEHPTVDTDGDGEPDAYEIANGHSPTDPRNDESDTDNDDVPDWLDPDTVLMARASSTRRAAVAASPIDCGNQSRTYSQLDRRGPRFRGRLSPVTLV